MVTAFGEVTVQKSESQLSPATWAAIVAGLDFLLEKDPMMQTSLENPDPNPNPYPIEVSKKSK